MAKYKKEEFKSEKIKFIYPSIPAGISEKKPTFLERIYKTAQKFAGLFRSAKEPSLHGRIHELKSYADEYCRDLQNIKSEFDRERDPEAYIFIEAIIDPLLKEIQIIQQHIHEVRGIALQAKGFKNYGEWVERARQWVQFYEGVTYREEIVDAVVKYLIGEALTRIERDINIINEYQIHQLADAAVPEERRQALQEAIAEGVKPYLDHLKSLKKRPDVLTLDGLGQWKAQIDASRQIYFEKSLHLVDAFVEREVPLQPRLEDRDQLKEIISAITYQEREVRELLHEIRECDLSDSVQRAIVRNHLEALAEDVAQQGANPYLSWDLLERLQNLTDIVESAKISLNQRYPSG